MKIISTVDKIFDARMHVSRIKKQITQVGGHASETWSCIYSCAENEHQGPVLLLRHDAVARILANRSAAFIESWAAIGWYSCDSVRSLLKDMAQNHQSQAPAKGGANNTVQ